ncbi:Protein CBG21271 [Caenorhabditis briggsae]|uniref:Protein CBG21271 n=1 Tax=Caenorhabditis briggsae TaxID=6238 RepID=A8XZQ9_CAEBR|nr:Protein CBG21271 [Caenorhabditis briggsae]CAP38126.2 Protein CBG21271 [Caenorhabditis briggsae]
MVDGYDLLIKAQFSETMDALEFNLEDVLESIEAEKRFDVRERLLERIAFLIYQDSNFGLLPINAPTESVSSCINRLCKSTFSFPIDLPNLLEFSFAYPSSACLAEKLLDSDERFLTSILALLPLIESLDRSSVFHPVSVFLESIHLINYDCEVLIDWLNSELAASSLILRVLKSNCNVTTRQFWTNYKPAKTPPSTYTTTFRDEPTIKSATSKPIISLKIIEIVGDQEMTKNLNLRAIETKKVATKKPKILKNSGKFEKWIEMVLELRARLRRLLAANLVAKKLDLILKWCDKFCDIFDNE